MQVWFCVAKKAMLELESKLFLALYITRLFNKSTLVLESHINFIDVKRAVSTSLVKMNADYVMTIFLQQLAQQW